MTTNDEDLCLRAVDVADGTVSVSAVSALGAILDRAVDNLALGAAGPAKETVPVLGYQFKMALSTQRN
jgi:hypothetical protein